MVLENMKKQLALAVRSIQWSYAIFWSASSCQPGVLEWGEGYYNGDIKTRKTSQAVQLRSDQIGLQRSEQLRELFESLATAESTQQTKGPSTALSPEDLTDTEWYYLVCMSFVFNIGQGLPGRTLANDQPIWVYNAPFGDSRIFSRSLLAKSASIQTVACFPFLEGVVELGTSDLISEDLSLIQRIKTSFLDVLGASKSGSAFKTRNKKDITSAAFGHSAYYAKLPEVGSAVNNKTSPNSLSAIEANQLADETHVVERVDGGSSLVHSWQVRDDEFCNDAHNSMISSDCSSQTLADPEKIACCPKDQNPTDHSVLDHQECNKTKMTLKNCRNDGWHYRKVLSAVLKDSDQSVIRAHFQSSNKESSFVSYKKGGSMSYQMLKGGTPQKLLKKVLLEVPRMHMDGLLECQEENDYKEQMRPEVDEIGMNHVLSERRRRAKLNERFLTLRSMVPSVSKDDKVSILDEAIEYLRKLEKKIRELEACRELIDLETRAKRTPQDMVERTSDNYFNKTDNGMKPMHNKRKACDVKETWQENDSVALNDSSTSSVIINMSNTEVLIEMKHPWREGAVMKIMEALRNLHLDLRSIQSSEVGGILHLTIRSQMRGPTIASAKKIKQVLQKAAWNC
ncbi:transcription factor EGL1-like isoform X1 [Prosopis cineraria]|uniref:transcription factor EGL1-like isoform X1 n=1 Tax=Prosopis cineraria TaxID=364024 RepID=UPI00241013B0|nr:transcription factor EGL1-like isoform X1 [Prosopis cineraria]XP_054808863.1 transcription factor EGL1-like isoform X1 [Prosopis cineraria]